MIHQYLFLSALCFPTWQCGSAVPFPLLPRILPSFSLSPTTFAQMRCTKRPSSKLQIKPHKDQIRTRCNYVPHMQGSIVKKLYFLTYSSKLVKFTISMLYNFSCAPSVISCGSCCSCSCSATNNSKEGKQLFLSTSPLLCLIVMTWAG